MSFCSDSVGARELRAGRKRNRCVIDDGFNAELVADAYFDGELEIPKIHAPEKIIVPRQLIPFSQRNQSRDFSEFLAFYEHDVKFSSILQRPEFYVEDFRRFQGLVSPDFSLYRDMPLVAQIANVYRNRALGYFFQKHGVYVIPNVRWGDERSYTHCVYRECFAFLGLPKHSIVSIGTYGCVKGADNALHFRQGLRAMLEYLDPEIVLVYGSMPDSIFGDVKSKVSFIQFPDWISLKKGEKKDGNR